jgi:hypothetical protein
MKNQRNTAEELEAIAGPGGTYRFLDRPSKWLSGRITEIDSMYRDGGLAGCPHVVADAAEPGVVALWRPTLVVCRRDECLQHLFDGRGLGERRTCDLCGRLSVSVHPMTAAPHGFLNGDALGLWGSCCDCADREGVHEPHVNTGVGTWFLPPVPAQGCCKVLIHAPHLVKRARRSARSESHQRSWRRQADHHIALTSEPSTARHAGGPPDRWLGWCDSACCLPSPQVRPRNVDFAMALVGPVGQPNH